MGLSVVILSFTVICFTMFVTLLFVKDDITNFKKIIGIVFLIFLFGFTFYTMRLYRYDIENKSIKIISIMISLIMLTYLVIEKTRNKISDLSIKSAIDLSKNGIMFFKNKKVLVTNNIMNDILRDLNITNDYIINILKNVNENMFLKSLNKIWQVKYSDKELILYDVTDIYNLKLKTQKKNKLIESNNKKIIETLNVLEELERKENLIRLKNEFHDVLGSRLLLFSSLLEKNRINKEDAKYLINNLFTSDEEKKPKDLLKDLINIYKIFDINIKQMGELPNNKKNAKIFFEVIREATTNAIRHANSKNIYIVIRENEMIISNDGVKPTEEIIEGDGLRGIRRKIKTINGKVKVTTVDNFKIHIILE